MKNRIESVIKNLGKKLSAAFIPKVEVLPLQLIRVDEKFDVVVRPPFRGGFIIHNKD